jgi:membrane associated rhomboid family serine protease
LIPIRDNIPSRRAPVVTWTLIALNAVVFFYELDLGPSELRHFMNLFGVVPSRYSHPDWARTLGDYWPFFTSMFLHAGWLHIIGNMWALWIFGDNVEDRMGRLRFLLFYLLTGLVAGLTHTFTNPESTVPSMGASGAIAGVLGAYFVLFPRAQIVVMFPVLFWPFFFQLPAFIYLLFWFLSQVFGGAVFDLGSQNAGGVAWWAHVGGFASGVVLHRLFLLPRRSSSRAFERDESGIEGAWT